jgi:antitoxin PrlF
MYKMKVSSKGQVTIPRQLRDEMGLNTVVFLLISETKGGYIIKKQIDEEKVKKYVGILNQQSSSDRIVEELRGNGCSD